MNNITKNTLEMKKYTLGQTFDLQSYMEALNNEYEKRQKHNSLRIRKGKEGRWN